MMGGTARPQVTRGPAVVGRGGRRFEHVVPCPPLPAPPVGPSLMCIGYPARVIEVDVDGALVDDGGRRRRASTLLLPDVPCGAWVLVAAGSIVRELDAAEAADLVREISRARALTDAARATVPADPTPAGACDPALDGGAP
jgi:hydrogenase expression/formation protein HypC